jgi:hypothetical protein
MHGVQTWNLGTNSAFALGQKTVEEDGGSMLLWNIGNTAHFPTVQISKITINIKHCLMILRIYSIYLYVTGWFITDQVECSVIFTPFSTET